MGDIRTGICMGVVFLVCVILLAISCEQHSEKMKIIETQLEEANYEIRVLKDIINDHEQFNNRSAKVKITFYAPSLGGINSDSNPNKTAIMDKPVAGWTCAISRDLVEKGWLGRKLYIKGLGIRYASDIMGASYKGKPITNQIDICVGKSDVQTEARMFGTNTNITATVL